MLISGRLCPEPKESALPEYELVIAGGCAHLGAWGGVERFRLELLPEDDEAVLAADEAEGARPEDEEFRLSPE